MNIREERERLGLSQADFIRRVKPYMKSFELDIKLLSQLEDGKGAPDRRQVLERAIEKAFPSNESRPRQPIVPEQKRKSGLAEIWRKWGTATLIFPVLVFSAIVFFWFHDHPYAKMTLEFSGIASIILAVFALDVFKSKK